MAFERLEPYDGKLSSTVLMGAKAGNSLGLPGENVFDKLPHAVIIDKEYGYFYISNLLWYIDRKLPEGKRDELSSLIIEHLPKSDGEEIMRTVADSYIDQGIQIGISQGIEQSAIKMLKQNLDLKLIASITGFSQEELLKLKHKI